MDATESLKESYGELTTRYLGYSVCLMSTDDGRFRIILSRDGVAHVSTGWCPTFKAAKAELEYLTR